MAKKKNASRASSGRGAANYGNMMSSADQKRATAMMSGSGQPQRMSGMMVGGAGGRRRG